MHSSRHVSEITSNDLLLDCLMSDLDNTADLLTRHCPNNFDEEAIIIEIVLGAVFVPSKRFLGNLVCSNAAVLKCYLTRYCCVRKLEPRSSYFKQGEMFIASSNSNKLHQILYSNKFLSAADRKPPFQIRHDTIVKEAKILPCFRKTEFCILSDIRYSMADDFMCVSSSNPGTRGVIFIS